MTPNKLLTLCLAFGLSACQTDPSADRADDSTSGDSDSTSADEVSDLPCDDPGDGDGDPCTTPFIVDPPNPAPAGLPIVSDEIHELPLGGYLRFIERDAGTTVLIFAGLSGHWPSASSYLTSIDVTTIMSGVNLAIVEAVNPYGIAHDAPTIDPDLFTGGPGESPYVTWGWWSWDGGDVYDPLTPGAYPILIETGDAIADVVGDVDVFVQLGKEAGSRTFGCGNGSPYDCNGHSVMAYGGAESYALASAVASSLAELEPAWAPWDLEHPLGGGFIYDDPAEGYDRWLGTAAHWAHETWSARTIEVIFPTNAPLDDCAQLLAGESDPAPWPADNNYRMRTRIESAATVAAALKALDDVLD